MQKHVLIADAEIQKCIPDRKTPPDPWYRYCQGWQDFAGMGISVVCAYTSFDDRYRVFMEDNLPEFQQLCLASAERGVEFVGLNSKSFDDNLFRANGISFTTTYDLLIEARIAAGFSADWRSVPKGRTYSLDAIAFTNFGEGKSGDGAAAPKLYQDGKLGELADYCLSDVTLTKKIWDKRDRLLDPNDHQVLTLRPWSEEKTVIQPNLF